MTQAKEVTPEVRARLEELANTLRAQLGDDLVGLLVFGSAARGGWVEHRSDVDLVLVLREPTREKLLRIANPLNVARNALRFEAVILSAEEIPRAADVFPLFYDDIKSCNLVLTGKDPFAELEISDLHRRLRVEQELREMAIRLHRAIVDAQGAPERLAGPVERKVKQLRGPLYALLALRKTPAEADSLEKVLEKAHTEYQLETKALLAVRKDPIAALDQLGALLKRAIDEVDRMED
jgi:predicted nucleotidyltransferase